MVSRRVLNQWNIFVFLVLGLVGWSKGLFARPGSPVIAKIPLSEGQFGTLYLGVEKADGRIYYLERGLQQLRGYLVNLASQRDVRQWSESFNGKPTYEVEGLILGMMPPSLVPPILRQHGIGLHHLLEPNGMTHPKRLDTLRRICQLNTLEYKDLEVILGMVPLICHSDDQTFRDILEAYQYIYDFPIFSSLRRHLNHVNLGQSAALAAGDYFEQGILLGFFFGPYGHLSKLARLPQFAQKSITLCGRPLPGFLSSFLIKHAGPLVASAFSYLTVLKISQSTGDRLASQEAEADLSRQEWAKVQLSYAFSQDPMTYSRNADALDSFLANNNGSPLSEVFKMPILERYLLNPVNHFDLASLASLTVYDNSGYEIESNNAELKKHLEIAVKSNALLGNLVEAYVKKKGKFIVNTYDQLPLNHNPLLSPRIVIAKSEKAQLTFKVLLDIVEGLWYGLDLGGPERNIARYESANALCAALAGQRTIVAYLATRIAKELSIQIGEWLPILDTFETLRQGNPEIQEFASMRDLLPHRADQVMFILMEGSLKQKAAILFDNQRQ